MDETISTSLYLSYKIIFYIGPHPWPVSGKLSYHIYGTYFNVYTVQCNVSTDNSIGLKTYTFVLSLVQNELKTYMSRLDNFCQISNVCF